MEFLPRKYREGGFVLDGFFRDTLNFVSNSSSTQGKLI